jgi:hypothetical protein
MSDYCVVVPLVCALVCVGVCLFGWVMHVVSSAGQRESLRKCADSWGFQIVRWGLILSCIGGSLGLDLTILLILPYVDAVIGSAASLDSENTAMDRSIARMQLVMGFQFMFCHIDGYFAELWRIPDAIFL